MKFQEHGQNCSLTTATCSCSKDDTSVDVWTGELSGVIDPNKPYIYQAEEEASLSIRDNY